MLRHEPRSTVEEAIGPRREGVVGVGVDLREEPA